MKPLDLESIKGAFVHSVEITEGDNDDYCSYRISIVTDRGTLIITGCHDQGPDVEMRAQ